MSKPKSKKIIVDDDFDDESISMKKKVSLEKKSEKVVKNRSLPKTLTSNMDSTSFVNSSKKEDNKKENGGDPIFLNVMNNGGTSYIIKKYRNKPIASIYNESLTKVILVKRQVGFLEENGAYLIEMRNEKFKYVFVGGPDIYEFNLIGDDRLKSFKCNLGNSGAYLIGEKYTYFLSDKFCVLKNEDDPYDILYENKYEKVKFDHKIWMDFELYNK